jgi:hypothetical protein
MDLDEKCLFVTNVKECHDEENNINYMNLLFCDFESHLPLGIFLLVAHDTATNIRGNFFLILFHFFPVHHVSLLLFDPGNDS